MRHDVSFNCTTCTAIFSISKVYNVCTQQRHNVTKNQSCNPIRLQQKEIKENNMSHYRSRTTYNSAFHF